MTGLELFRETAPFDDVGQLATGLLLSSNTDVCRGVTVSSLRARWPWFPIIAVAEYLTNQMQEENILVA